MFINLKFLPRLERQHPDESPSGKRKRFIRWRCFVRAVASVGGCGRLVLSFVPASVRYLQYMRRCERSGSTISNSVSPRDRFQTTHDTPESNMVYRDIDDVVKHSLGTNFSYAGKSVS